MSVSHFFRRSAAALGQMFKVSAPAEWTLHDAMRALEESPPNIPPRRESLPSDSAEWVTICRYRSEAELRALWRFADDERSAGQMTVLLMFNRSLGANLRSLVGRRHPACRLVLLPEAGHWSGIDSAADLALASTKLGWQVIEVCRDARRAWMSVCQAMTQGRALVYLPASPSVNVPGFFLEAAVSMDSHRKLM